MAEREPAPLRVLVVDDDSAILRLIRLSLLSEGFDVVLAEDGLSGLHALEAGQFDALVLDLQMRGMDGRTMYRQMRSRGYELPVLILSAYGAEIARRELGAEAAMSKPFDIEEFIERILSLTQSRPASEQ